MSVRVLYGRALLGTGGQASVSAKEKQPGAATGSVILNVQEVAGGAWRALPLTPQQADKLASALRDAAVDVVLASD